MELSPEERGRVKYLEQQLNSFKIELEKLEQYLKSINVDPKAAKVRLADLSTLYEASLKYDAELALLQPENAQLIVFFDVEFRYWEVASAITKLQRVEPLLNSSVSKFDPSDKEYPKAWPTPLDFYQNKRIMARQHLDGILDLPRLTNGSAANLSTLLDRARHHLHILDGLGVQCGNDFVVCIIQRCLPSELRSKWEDELDMDELPKLDTLLTFIQTAILKQLTSE